MAFSVKLSVRELVEFLLQSGSITPGEGGGADRALEGARIHRRLQKAYGENAKTEVFLSLTTELGDFVYTVEGRADGILERDGMIVLDEIKTTVQPFDRVTEDFCPVHWAQAMCYAYFYGLQQDLSEMQVQLTYYQADTHEIKRFLREYTLAELEFFYLDLLRQYERWAMFLRDWSMQRDRSLRALAFPFSAYRAGQRAFAGVVYRAVCEGTRLFCQAPTGTGKTISTLFPALKAMGEGKTERIFYLTAKTISRQSAAEALSKMREGGMHLKSVTLTAKEKICFQEDCICTPEECPYANGYYDRINSVLYSLLQKEDSFTREELEHAAKEAMVCPFELSLDLSLWCDVIVCDYNYLFDPVVYLRRFFSERSGAYTFLVDEAHNLVARSREMYTARLQKSMFLALRKQFPKGELFRALGKVNTAFLALKKACGEQPYAEYEEIPETLLQPLEKLAAACSAWLEKNREHVLRAEVLPVFFAVRFFLKISDLFDARFVMTVVPQPKDVQVSLLCLDPSALNDQALARGRAAVLFSATLAPPGYYRSVLGGGETAKSYALPSPFPQENLLLLCADGISLRYADRERNIEPVCDLLHAFLSGKQGNYLVYFPSYQYMNAVHAVFCQRYPEHRLILQSGGMEEADREAFLRQFRSQEQAVTGFCVLGGVFAEGIDLPGEALIGTAIIGTGLPKVEREQELLRAYYDGVNGAGFDFAYRFPGMNKVLQAAGRVIRSQTDRGAVLLIDSRFSQAAYRRLFPPHWSHLRFLRRPEEIEEALRSFWETPQKDANK